MGSAGRLLVALVAVALLAGCVSLGGPGGSDAGPTTADDGAAVEGGAAVPAGARSATVIRVVDGDTVEVELDSGETETVRLIGVDTPEVHSENTPEEYGLPDTDAVRACLDRAGERASAFATEALAGESVRIAPDENLDERGYYGRLLAYVYVDGESFNRRLVAEGHARVFESDFAERATYERERRAARDAGRGLWGCADDTDARLHGAPRPVWNDGGDTVTTGGEAVLASTDD